MLKSKLEVQLTHFRRRFLVSDIHVEQEYVKDNFEPQVVELHEQVRMCYVNYCVCMSRVCVCVLLVFNVYMTKTMLQLSVGHGSTQRNCILEHGSGRCACPPHSISFYSPKNAYIMQCTTLPLISTNKATHSTEVGELHRVCASGR
jgi:hypothetical protein